MYHNSPGPPQKPDIVYRVYYSLLSDLVRSEGKEKLSYIVFTNHIYIYIIIYM